MERWLRVLSWCAAVLYAGVGALELILADGSLGHRVVFAAVLTGLAVLVVHTTPLVIFPVSVFALGSRDELVPRTLFGAFLVLAGIALLAIR